MAKSNYPQREITYFITIGEREVRPRNQNPEGLLRRDFSEGKRLAG